LPANVHGEFASYKIKNFATKSLMPDANFGAEGACFFQHAPGGIGNPNGAIKIMHATTSAGANAKYLGLRDLPLAKESNLGGGASGGEIAFASVAMLKSISDPREVFPYITAYANDPSDSNKTKLVGAMDEGFDLTFASIYDLGNNNNHIYGVLELQDWVNDTPPTTKTVADFESAGRKWTSAEFNQLFSSVIKPYANQNPALILTGNPRVHRHP
jgi:hypothetical protein